MATMMTHGLYTSTNMKMIWPRVASCGGDGAFRCARCCPAPRERVFRFSFFVVRFSFFQTLALALGRGFFLGSSFLGCEGFLADADADLDGSRGELALLAYDLVELEFLEDVGEELALGEAGLEVLLLCEEVETRRGALRGAQRRRRRLER